MLKFKNIIIYSAFIISFFIFAYKLFFSTYWFDLMFLPCLEFIKQGTLYRGQPLCEQGPFLFLIAYPFWLIFKNNIYYAIKFVTLISFAVLFYLILIIIKKETKKFYTFWVGIMLFFLYFVFLVDPFLGYRFVDVIVLLFLLLGLYLYLYSKSKYRYFLIGFFFSIAPLTKLNSLIPILIILIYIFIKDNKVYYKDKKLTHEVNKSNLKGFIFIILTMIIINLILIFKYPLFPVYVLSGFYLVHYTYTEAIKFMFLQLFSFKFLFFFYLIILITSIMITIKKSSIFSIISLITIPLLMIGQNRVSEFVFQFRYLSIIIPFFIIAFIKSYHEFKSDKFYRIFMVVLFFIVLFPGLYFSLISTQKRILENEVNQVINLIPKQSKPILTNIDLKLQFNADVGEYELLTNIGAYDQWTAPNFEKMGLVNLTEYYKNSWSYALDYHIPRIMSDKYGAIIIGPQGLDTDIVIILGFINTVHKLNEDYLNLKQNQNEEIFTKIFLNKTLFFQIKDKAIIRFNIHEITKQFFKCGINFETLGLTSDDRYVSFIFLEDMEDCYKFVDNYSNFIKQNFQSICKKDELVANIMINNSLLTDTGNLMEFENVTCNSKKQIIGYYNALISNVYNRTTNSKEINLTKFYT